METLRKKELQEYSHKTSIFRLYNHFESPIRWNEDKGFFMMIYNKMTEKLTRHYLRDRETLEREDTKTKTFIRVMIDLSD